MIYHVFLIIVRVLLSFDLFILKILRKERAIATLSTTVADF